MTTPAARRIAHGDHGTYTVVGGPISKGGVGAIYRLTDPRWVYKEYHSPDKAPTAVHLEQLVEIGRDVLIQQGLEIGARPESSVNWPVDIVRQSDRQIIGCVLPAIPQRYFHPTLGTVNTLDFLVMIRSKPPPATKRLIVLLRMAEILAFVHSKGLVHGDINAKNVAWTVTPTPEAYLIDCDGMVPQDPPPKVGVQAVYWTDPRVVDKVVPAHDHYSDWYCLALAFYRGLLLIKGGALGKQKDGTWSAPGQIPSDLDPRVAALMRRGLTDPLDASKRPEPAEWVRVLIEVYVAGGKYDETALARLDKELNAPRPRQGVTPGTFTPLPPPSPPQPSSGTRHQPPPYQQYRPPQPQQQPYWHRPPPPPPHRPAQVYQRPPIPQPPLPQYPPPQYVSPPPYAPTPGKDPGALARWAMGGGVAWYLPLALLSFCLWPVGGIVCGLVLAQSIRTYSGYPGRTAAIVSSCLGLGLSGFALLSWLVGLAA
ncbi:hypothetical protein IRY44_00680 [Micromonospora sp. ANENR4]|uniref:hypothetical protein n=1 Tax=Micromonospora sp. ANENR4 TaxID=2783662 RepID=UPI00188DDCAD|nr:hypothetical protein [Micromonospora sp. ANENR4]MBF5028243.1 hypothetical protein [Micromonospora sp. ANENR4]